MDAYYRRRIVSWVCFHLSRGKEKSQILALAARRLPPIPAEWVEEAWPQACQACRNADLIRNADPSMRLCDIPGIRFPRP